MTECLHNTPLCSMIFLKYSIHKISSNDIDEFNLTHNLIVKAIILLNPLLHKYLLKRINS